MPKPQRKASPSPAASVTLECARRVLRIESEAIAGLLERLDQRFDRAVDLLFACRGRIVVTGMGKSGLIGRKIAATFASTGSPSLFLHPAEALHGDLGMVVAEDVVLAISYSGETAELIELVEILKRIGTPLLTLTAYPGAPLASASDVVLDIAVREEACSLNLAPTASTTAALAMGDALAIALLERRGFRQEDFAALHPAGRLGKQLRRIESLMHSGDDIPRVSPGTRMPDLIYEISRKGLGMAVVTEEANLDQNRWQARSAQLPGSVAVPKQDRVLSKVLGIVTDGDLRRTMAARKKDALDLTAAECMTRNPVTLRRSDLASTALRLMQERRITSVLVTDAAGSLEGVVHIHDLWTLQLF